MIEFHRSSVQSGNTIVAGFKQDSQFIPIEPTPNYLEFLYSNFFNKGQRVFKTQWTGDCDLELVNLITGTKDRIRLESVEVAQGQDILWYSSFGIPFPPFKFQQGILIPSGAFLTISMMSEVQYLRLLVKPVSVISLGSLSAA